MEWKNVKKQEEYWNDPSIIQEFEKMQYNEYWLEFVRTKKNNCKIADIGCGTGRSFIPIYNAGYDIWGCDLHEDMVKAIQKKVKGKDKRRIKIGNVLDLPYDNHLFDIVISNGVLHNLESYVQVQHAIAEMKRVLKPGGYLCLNLFTSSYISAELRHIEDRLYLTAENITLLLLNTNEIIGILKEFKFETVIYQKEYNVTVFSGERSVLRGVYKSNG